MAHADKREVLGRMVELVAKGREARIVVVRSIVTARSIAAGIDARNAGSSAATR